MKPLVRLRPGQVLTCSSCARMLPKTGNQIECLPAPEVDCSDVMLYCRRCWQMVNALKALAK